VFLIHHDQPQLLHRREHPRPCPHHHRRRSRPDPPPLLGSLHVRERAVQNGDAVAEPREELSRHRRRQRDLRHQQQRPAPLLQCRLDRAQINFRLSRTRNAVEQKCLKRPRANCRLDLLERRCLRGIQLVPRADRPTSDRHRLRLQRDHALSCQRPRRPARPLHRILHLAQIMRPRMQFQKCLQLPLRLRKFQSRFRGHRSCVPRPLIPDPRSLIPDFHPQSLRRRPQRIPLRLHLLSENESLPFQRPDRLIRQRQRPRQVCRRKRPFLQHAQHLRHGIVGPGIQQQLPRSVPPRVRQRINLPPTDFRRQRQHRPQHLSQRRAVISRDPPSERQQFFSQHRLAVDQPQRLPRRHIRSLVMASQDQPRQLSRPERHHNPAPRRRAMPQC
jgi:hypothetical protein